jgi:long-chain acyl-CoA synthetase
LDRVHNFGAGLCKIGAQPGQDTLIGIYAQNAPEWDIAMLATVAYSRIVVPLYDTLGAEAVSFILSQARLRYVVCDTTERAQKLLDCFKDYPGSNAPFESLESIVRKLPLEHIILTKPAEITDDLRKKCGALGVKVHSFQEVEAQGIVKPMDVVSPTPEDLFIICYTSGTTGAPKGVMISHGGAVAEAACVEYFLANFSGHDLYPGRKDIALLCYLPLAHLFEVMAHVTMYGLGYKIGYFSGDIKKVIGDLKACKPIVLPVVPRLLNRVYDQLEARRKKSFVFNMLFSMAYRVKWAELEAGVFRWDTLWDRILWDRIRGQMGGRTEVMVTGSAPIAGEVLNLCRVALGCDIVEGYGQTECTAGCTLTLPGDLQTEQVGSVFPGCHIKLCDVPDLDYYARNDVGEVCIRGPIVMKGYYQDPMRTSETIDEDGWLHTGDVGKWLPNGALKIIDRKKHIFKLAQGEYVAPEKIESVYMRASIVSQIYVDGNSLERYLVAVVVPDETELRAMAVKECLGGSSGEDRGAAASYAELCENEALSRATLAELRAMGKANGLNSIEQIQAVYLCPEPFSTENGLLTPTLKSKRPQLRKRFADVIERLYTKTG